MHAKRLMEVAKIDARAVEEQQPPTERSQNPEDNFRNALQNTFGV